MTTRPPDSATIPDVLHLPSDHVRRVLLATLARPLAERVLQELAAVPGLDGEGVVVTDEDRMRAQQSLAKMRRKSA